MHDDLISIIIPVYNVAPYLEQCVNSVRQQTYSNLEIILVDDGSTDGSGAICDAYAAEDARIQVIHKENGGQGLARNVGLEIAHGSYIGFVDSDDFIAPTMYEVLHEKCVQNDLDLVIARYCEVVDGENQATNATGDFSMPEARQLMEAYLFGSEEYAITPAVWNRLYRREILENIKFPEGKYEDVSFTTEVLLSAKRCGYFDKVVYYYRIRNASTMTEVEDTEEKICANFFGYWVPQFNARCQILENAGEDELAAGARNFVYLTLLDKYYRFRSGKEYKKIRKLICREVQKNRRRYLDYIKRSETEEAYRVAFVFCYFPNVLRNYWKLRGI